MRNQRFRFDCVMISVFGIRTGLRDTQSVLDDRDRIDIDDIDDTNYNNNRKEPDTKLEENIPMPDFGRIKTV